MTHGDNAAVGFFDRQFRRQIAQGEYSLNPFEALALPFCAGEMLDLGCGLGNLSLAAAACGARVTALDACPSAVEDLRQRARADGLPIEASALDLVGWRPGRTWDTVACIGLLMFFKPQDARAGLQAAKAAVAPGGVAIVNVLVEGTTYLDMFDPGGYCLFEPGELSRAFAGWELLEQCEHTFPAPGGTVKRFETVIARK